MVLVATATACSGSSVSVTSSGSSGEIMPRGSNVLVIQSNRPRQYAVSNSTTGVGSTLCVCTSVRSSNISSSVPNPPGQMITPDEYLTNMVLRTKKYRKL